jgi:Mrp family chromosome partitioning ATPase
VAAAPSSPGVEFVERATPPGAPVWPRPRRIAFLASVFAAVLATALAWWRLVTRQRAEHRHDPSEVLGAPLLGEVPDFDASGVSDDLPVVAAAHSAPAEAYQFILSSLSYALAGANGNAVLITSASPADGKTVTTLNLSLAAALDQRRVVVVDSDERVRGLTERCGLSDAPGLLNMAHQGLPLEWAVSHYDVPGHPGLDIVPFGTGDMEAGGFFRTGGFRQAMESVRSGADLVFVDSPPLLAVADTSAVAGQVNGIVLVVSKGTPLQMLRDMRERLEFVGTPLLGYIFNRGEETAGGYGYTGYGQPTHDDNGNGASGWRRGVGGRPIRNPG